MARQVQLFLLQVLQQKAISARHSLWKAIWCVNSLYSGCVVLAISGVFASHHIKSWVLMGKQTHIIYLILYSTYQYSKRFHGAYYHGCVLIIVNTIWQYIPRIVHLVFSFLIVVVDSPFASGLLQLVAIIAWLSPRRWSQPDDYIDKGINHLYMLISPKLINLRKAPCIFRTVYCTQDIYGTMNKFINSLVLVRCGNNE